jgi:hypothetical protein
VRALSPLQEVAGSVPRTAAGAAGAPAVQDLLAPTVLEQPLVSFGREVCGDQAAALALLRPFEHHLRDAGLGTISEILEGDPPHLPRGCIAQAWAVAEVLRVWRALEPELSVT